MSNNFDTAVILDTATDYYGFGRAAGTSVSTGPRIYNHNAPNGVLVAPKGSIALSNDIGTGDFAGAWLNTDGGNAWSLAGSSGGGIVFSGRDTPLNAGGATQAFAAAGVEVGDVAFAIVEAVDTGIAIEPVLRCVAGAGTITVTFSNIPGNSDGSVNLIAVRS